VHPELLSYLAAEHRCDLAAALTTSAVPSARTGRRAHPVTLPRFRVSWTRTTLAAVSWSSSSRPPGPSKPGVGPAAVVGPGDQGTAEGPGPGGGCARWVLCATSAGITFAHATARGR
jgi:hypothetical protein